ncbi:hypothetical protein [Lacrimispora brassicae]
MKLIEDSAKAECADDTFDAQYRIIANEIKELRKKKQRCFKNDTWQNPMNIFYRR